MSSRMKSLLRLPFLPILYWELGGLESYTFIPAMASTTPLVTCLSRALDGHDPESLCAGWFHDYLGTRIRQ
jgi:hypothetical protein